jgi:sulfoxide reductase heme-binding subunit YedZ
MTQYLNGWRLTGTLTLLLIVMVALILAIDQASVDSIRMGIRATARTSLALFLPVFAASALIALAPGPATGWLRRNRRYIGVGFAASHTIHGILIIAFATIDPEQFWSRTSMATLYSGGLAYLFIFVMAATSFDRAVRWLGPRNWRILHTTGLWYLWISLVITFGKRGPEMPVYWLAVVLLVITLALRLAARVRARPLRTA